LRNHTAISEVAHKVGHKQRAAFRLRVNQPGEPGTTLAIFGKLVYPR
jgi:hypothetical protein